MSAEFYSVATVVYEFVHVKRKSPIKQNGVLKTLIPIAIVGSKDSMQGKSLSSLYDDTLESSLPIIVRDLSTNNSNVLFVSDSRLVDLNNDFCDNNKTYVSDLTILDAFEKSF